MSRQQKLTDFQGQLAQKLKDSQDKAMDSRWLAAIAGGSRILLPLPHVGEISGYTPPSPMPHAKPWFMGVVNIRGMLYGVTDLAVLIGASEAGARKATNQARFVQFTERLDLNAVFMLDQVIGLRTPEQFSIEDDSMSRDEWLGVKLRDENGKIWRELNLVALSENEDFLRVSV